MIVGFVGTPGSGKTYEAVKKIVFNLQKGRHVYTDIDGMNEGPCREMIKALCDFDDWTMDKQFHFLTRDEVARFWEIARPNSMIVLDEVHKTFNCRDWASNKNNAFADWASTHRHNGFDLILITQDMEKVEKQVRSLLEWTYVFRKVNFFGGAVQKKYMCYSHSGDDVRGKPLSTSIRHYEQKFFRCYKSYSNSDAKEVGFMAHVNVLRHPVFLILPVVLGLAIYMLFTKSSLASGDLFGHKKVQQKQDAVIKKLREKDAAKKPFAILPESPSAAVQPVFGQHTSSVASVTSTDNDWKIYRIDGYIQDGSKLIVMIAGVPVKLPHKDVRKLNRMTGICVARYSTFGDPPQRVPQQLNVSPPETKENKKI